MKKVLLTVGIIGMLTSCQDKFEQIDANFAYLDEKIEVSVADLQNQIEDNKQAIADLNVKIDNDVNALESYVDMHVDILNQVDADLADNIAARIADVNDAIALLQFADEKIDTKVDELNALQLEINTATASQVADLQANYAIIENDLNNQVAQLKADLLSHFNTISVDTALAVAEFLAAQQLDVTSIVIEVVSDVVGNVSNDVVTPVETMTATSTTSTMTMNEPSVRDQVVTFLNGTDTSITINGSTITRVSVNLWRLNGPSGTLWRGVTTTVTFEDIVNDYVNAIG